MLFPVAPYGGMYNSAARGKTIHDLTTDILEVSVRLIRIAAQLENDTG
jgi:hypothetical protein